MARAVDGTIRARPAASSPSSWLHRLTGDVNPVFLSIAVVAALLFAALTVLVAIHPAPFFFDRPIEVAVQSINARPFAWFNTFVSAFAGLVGVGVGAAVIVLTLLLRRPATPFVAFSAVYSVLYNVVNIIIQRPRPTGVAHTTSNLMGYSYPSGHAGFFLWLSVLALVLLARRLPRPLYVASWVLAVVLVVAAGISRIYVGAHWPSDVVGGLLVGLAWICLSLSLGSLTKPIFEHRRTGSR
jgi:membrane-associated phospholipid phosphatase